MAERRTFWAGKSQEEEQTNTRGTVPLALPQISVVDLIKGPKKPRNRAWEKVHRAKTFRSVPEEVSTRVLAIADQVGVTADEVARAFLEYGLFCMERETLTIQPKVKGTRMTLYPLDSGWTKQNGWVEEGWNPVPKAVSPSKSKRRQKGEEPRLWASRVAYRLPDELVKQVKEKADRYNVPVGELVGLLLKHSANRYEQGVLRLTPYPKQDAQARWDEG
uniref:Uncharacterized protein n=1 Tax=Bellilinea caldifistulae TaxID=360411 RepID=A0A7C4Q3B0_9CHLR